jgi:hypothetical protein
MNRATFNRIVDACKNTTCYHCGYKINCEKLENAGIKVSNGNYYSNIDENSKMRLVDVKWEESE